MLKIMKTQNNNILLFAIILSSAFLFHSCIKDSSSNNSSPCGPQINNYYYVSASDKANIPYTGTDTIKLQYSGGPTANFIGQKKDSGYDKQAVLSTDCPNQIINNTQYYNTKYVSSNYSLPLYVKVGQPYGVNTSYLTINFDNKDFIASVSDISVTKYQKIFIINGKQYSAISMIPFYNYTDTIYFSKDYGIVKMISSANTWTIIP